MRINNFEGIDLASDLLDFLGLKTSLASRRAQKIWETLGFPQNLFSSLNLNLNVKVLTMIHCFFVHFASVRFNV